MNTPPLQSSGIGKEAATQPPSPLPPQDGGAEPKPPKRPAPRRYQRPDPLSEARRLRMLREIVETITLTILMFLVFRFAVQNYRVDGHSMEPTLQDQQYILVNKAAYLFHPPERGDIIVFAYPVDPSQDYIKRIVGIPGDHVVVDQNGLVFINSTQLHETYLTAPTNPYEPTDLKLGPGQYFVLGDNRGDSSDSRVWGPVPRQNIIGKAWFVYWPLGAFHFIPSQSAVFAGISP